MVLIEGRIQNPIKHLSPAGIRYYFKNWFSIVVAIVSSSSKKSSLKRKRVRLDRTLVSTNHEKSFLKKYVSIKRKE